MFTNLYDDKPVFCVLESIALAIVTILSAQAGHNLAIFLTNRMNIPYDLSLTFMSFGFGNEIVILSTLFSIVLTVFIIEKVIPYLVEYIFLD